MDKQKEEMNPSFPVDIPESPLHAIHKTIICNTPKHYKQTKTL